MNGWLLLALTAILAAFIGFITNVIAVSMLFRPRKSIFIGNWRLPFTPGLIPKRHEDIAHHLGRIVMEHLLTVEGLQGRLTEQRFQNEVNTWVKEGAKKWLSNEERSLQEIAEHYGSWTEPHQTVEERLKKAVNDRIDVYWQDMQTQTIEQIIPDDWSQNGRDFIPIVAHGILERLRTYLYSKEGKAQVQRIIQTFIQRRGSIIQMLDSFVRTEKMVERVYPEVVDALTSPDIENWLQKKLHEEYDKVMEKKGTDILSEERVEHYRLALTDIVMNEIPIEDVFHKPVNEWAEKIDFIYVDQISDSVIQQAGRFLEVNMSGILKSLRLDHIVSEQVKAFPLARLEEIVVNISNRELRMIKILGGILGGTIGIVQGLLILLLV
ncbi:DUF445 family protein [Salicibibacter halophilus]|uniref:DUF445 family protein n=1 Tax=Salicibibacter halophilus TaxID=2502791 RepID=A0A514LLP7_9BACI|nr:DUF445 family protein [Salicibibacter halophilus]QDI92784.1 DUF445 family protein [Salicibibacter halophilus]